MRLKLVHGYIRVSSQDQADSGLGLDAQRELVRETWERVWKPRGYGLGRIYEDRAVSGSRQLRSRKAGLAMSNDAEDGDVLLFPKLDRGFRDTKDMLTTVDAWAERGVRVVFLDINVDYGTTSGRLMMQMFGVIAEFERGRIADRTREALASRGRQGLPVGQAPFGTKMVGERGKKKLVVHPEELEVGRMIVKWRLANHAWHAIEAHLAQNSVFRPAARYGDTRGPKRRWRQTAIRRAYLGTLKVLRMIEEGKLTEPSAAK